MNRNLSNVLYNIVRDSGTDTDDWCHDDQREAAVALFKADESEKHPWWISDCLSEAGIDKGQREAIIAALAIDDESNRRQRLGQIFERLLRVFPKDELTRICEENLEAWEREDATCAANDDADSRAEQALLEADGDAPCVRG